ncbi:type II toxin-antitoxin system RelE/ParE family toxin [Deltaproteobacteria bacterium TL4]
MPIFVHGFAKNEKSNITPKELKAFKELAKVLLGLSSEALNTAIDNGDFIEVKI